MPSLIAATSAESSRQGPEGGPAGSGVATTAGAATLARRRNPASLEPTYRDLQDTCESLTAAAAESETRITAIADSAPTKAVQHIVRRTQELARSAAETELQALQAATREGLRAEFAGALARIGHGQNKQRHWTTAALLT